MCAVQVERNVSLSVRECLGIDRFDILPGEVNFYRVFAMQAVIADSDLFLDSPRTRGPWLGELGKCMIEN